MPTMMPTGVRVRSEREQRTLADFQSVHRGETIIVCGCGESLNLLEHPERFITIGVNDIGRKFDPTYLVVLNPRQQFAADRFRFVEQSRARYLFTQLDLGIAHPAIVKFRLGRYGGTSFTDPDVLHYTRNSPYVALYLAAYMGAGRIGLIGVDFTEHHFFGQTGVHPLAYRFPQIDREYTRLVAALRARGVDVVNLSPASRLTALPRTALETFVSPPASVAASASRPITSTRKRRVFFVNYCFLACGDVFATGLDDAADALGVEHDAAWWDDPALPAKIRAFGPDLVFVVHGRRAAQRWAGALREWKTAVWLVDEPYEVDDTSRWSSAFDTVFVNDPATVTRHRNAHALPVCFDPLLHRENGGVRDYRVGFIGGYNPVRELCLVRLAEEKLLSYVVGGPWRAAALRRLGTADRTTPAATARLYQRTQIVINVFRSVHHFNRAGVHATSLNPRVFEALACGALVVSEPRPALTALFPEVPTFSTDAELVTSIRHLLDDPAHAADLLAASRARLAGEDYAARLASVLAITLCEPARPTEGTDNHNHEPAVNRLTADRSTANQPTAIQSTAPDGWEIVGQRVTGHADATLTLVAEAGCETGLASTLAFSGVKLSFDVRLDARCHFIAKVQHGTRGDRGANSYHLVATLDRAYVARHHVVMSPATLARGAWQRVEMTWQENVLAVSIDGRESCRCADSTLQSGYCFVGVTGGAVDVRALQIDPVPQTKSCTVDGWSISGRGSVETEGDHFVLSASAQDDVSLVSVATDNDVELEFSALLDDHAHLIAKIHHQSRENPDANSYHLVSNPVRGYLARHGHVLAEVHLARRVWQRIRLRWVDQRLELFVNDRRRVRVADNLLQSGACVVGASGGRVEIRGLVARDLSARHASARVVPDTAAVRPGRDTVPFTITPRRNLLYHVWPVRGETWRWNVKQLRSRIDLFNGRRIVGIVHDARSEHPDEVRRMLDGCGCEFVIAANGPSGEGLTFPTMLDQIRSVDPNEVTFYAHAKGVKYEPAIPPPVRRWAETQYRVALDDWPSVRSQLERYAMTGSFKMLGRFRVHHYLGDWHYSGTFFWLRHAFVFARDVASPNGFYGCVEAWPGVHFRNEETGCLFMDALRQLPYQEEFWTTTGNAALDRWEATRPPLVPPASLQSPAPFDGCNTPRLEQHVEEFAWFLDTLQAASPRRLLCIGSMHGGVEWHIARRFRALGQDIRITAVDLEARPELRTNLNDARSRFNQQVDLVVGDSASPATRAKLEAQYDAVFVDGDHGYQGARADVDFAFTRSPRLVALHDIADSDWHAQARCCVSRVWAELRSTYSTQERIVSNWGGLGIVRL
jgi:predicted O-methyltransferase YrrM